MERILADILLEERSLGNKGDGGWKNTAYNTAAAILSAQFGLKINASNVKNRVKSWKKFYAIVSDILSQSGFSWDSNKKMLSIDDENVWKAYAEKYEGVEGFRFKVIENWDDIVDLCAKDRATGEGAETCSKATEVMTPPIDNVEHINLDGDANSVENINIVDDNSPGSASAQNKRNCASTNSAQVPPPKRRNSNHDVVADSITSMAASFEPYIRADTKSLDPIKVYTELHAIPDLTEENRVKACTWLIENEKQFRMLKALPIESKSTMVKMLIAREA